MHNWILSLGRATKPLPMSRVVLNEIMICVTRANPNVSTQLIRFMDEGILKGEIMTHRFRLKRYEEACYTFIQRKDGATIRILELGEGL